MAVTEPHLLFRLLDLLLTDLLTDGRFLHTKDVCTPLGQLLQAALNIQTWIESENKGGRQRRKLNLVPVREDGGSVGAGGGCSYGTQLSVGPSASRRPSEPGEGRMMSTRPGNRSVSNPDLTKGI